MTDKNLIRLLKVMMIIGITLILLGIYLHNSAFAESMGVKGILLSAACVAVGMILSLPTKMYLTFVLMKRENDTMAKSSAGPSAPGAKLKENTKARSPDVRPKTDNTKRQA